MSVAPNRCLAHGSAAVYFGPMGNACIVCAELLASHLATAPAQAREIAAMPKPAPEVRSSKYGRPCAQRMVMRAEELLGLHPDELYAIMFFLTDSDRKLTLRPLKHVSISGSNYAPGEDVFVQLHIAIQLLKDPERFEYRGKETMVNLAMLLHDKFERKNYVACTADLDLSATLARRSEVPCPFPASMISSTGAPYCPIHSGLA